MDIADTFTLDIYILSFDRPHYLGSLLRSLRDQDRLSFSIGEMVLFQDVPAAASATPARLDKIDECVDLFHGLFPDGIVERAAANLGILGNIERVFARAAASSADAFVILEDDLELGRFFLEVTKRVLVATDDHRHVGVVSAIGPSVSTAEGSGPVGLVPMGHKWSFALTRAKLAHLGRFLRLYFAACDRVGFRDNGVQTEAQIASILRFFTDMGFPTPPDFAAGHDAAIDVYGYIFARVNLTTSVNFARPIGETGVHFTPELFSELQLANVTVFGGDSVPDIVVPDLWAIMGMDSSWRETLFSRRLAEVSAAFGSGAGAGDD